MLLPSHPRIWLYSVATDMRKQFDGLAALAQTQLQEKVASGDWFVFINRKRTQMKVLYYHQGGYCLWGKRLEQGTYQQVPGALKELTVKELTGHPC